MELDPESIDLANLSARLRTSCGPTFTGAVVGRTVIRDEVATMLQCSLLEAEQLVDTLITRGFVRKETSADGQVQWVIAER